MSYLDWEYIRENIRPLRGGRTAKALSNAVEGSTISIKEAQERFENDFAFAQQSENPLDVFLHFISWFQEHFPTGKQATLYPLLTRVVNTYGYLEDYKNDEQMLKIWIKLAENKPGGHADVLFERAFTAGCCRRLAKFYVRWAEMLEGNHDIGGTRKVLQLGRENCAEPISLLNDASDALEMRQIRAMTTAGDRDDAAKRDGHILEQRVAFGALRGIGKDQIAPAIRLTDHIGRGLKADSQEGHIKKPPPAKGNGFYIFEEDDLNPDQDLLIPKDFGDNLAHIALAENSCEPSKWKEARVDGIRKVKSKHPPTFTIFDESDQSTRNDGILIGNEQTPIDVHNSAESASSQSYNKLRELIETKGKEKKSHKIMISEKVISLEEKLAETLS